MKTKRRPPEYVSSFGTVYAISRRTFINQLQSVAQGNSYDFKHARQVASIPTSFTFMSQQEAQDLLDFYTTGVKNNLERN